MTESGLDRLIRGADRAVFASLQNRRLGVITNQTGRTADGTEARHALTAAGLSIAALFSPEHGPAGRLEGAIGSSRTDDGIPIHSLYGETRRPTLEMLRGLDALVFDIQDVGARFYTYASTMAYAMEECAAHGMGFVVLDRPNPLGGLAVEGPAVDENVRSFVGHLRVPIVHGMTVGELARLHARTERLDLDLQIVTVGDWSRATLWPSTGLAWPCPSPNLPDYEAAAWYPALCPLEFSGVSVGRGTARPFAMVGAPWVDSDALLDKLKSVLARPHGGIRAESTDFIPSRAVFAGSLCRGLAFATHDAGTPAGRVSLAIELLAALHATHPLQIDEAAVRAALPLLGSLAVVEAILSSDVHKALASADADARAFKETRAEFLAY